jgi:anti-sigma factor RsiW
MKKKIKIQELLYLSFDGRLSEEEQRQLEDALASSPRLREEKARIETLRQTVTQQAVRSFRPFFAERVMHAIATAQGAKNGLERFARSLQLAFRRVALAGAAAILLLAVVNIVRTGDLSVTGALGMPQETLVDVLESPFDATVEELL